MDEEQPKKKPAFQIGQDLSLMSEEELIETIAILNAEITRIQDVVVSKSASRNAAEAFFKI